MPPDDADAARASEIDADIIRKLNALHYPASADPRAALERFRTDHKLSDLTDGQSTWQALSKEAGSTFGEVFQFELDALGGMLAIRYTDKLEQHAPAPHALSPQAGAAAQTTAAAHPVQYERRVVDLGEEARFGTAAGEARITAEAPPAGERGERGEGAGTAWAAPAVEAGCGQAAPRHYELPLQPAPLCDVLRRANRANLVGLAFSGGGIRSATFNLGVIQALAQLRMLREVDYLSTVSGGGYIGGWLSKYISEKGGSVEAVEEELAPSERFRQPRSEPSSVQFLRQYSNYLTPKKGLFSADTWTILSTYVRNTLLNLTMLVAFLSVLLLAPRVAAALADTMLATPTALAVVAIGLFLVAVFSIALSISRTGPTIAKEPLSQTQGAILLTVCLPLLLAAFFGSLAVWSFQVPMADFWNGLPANLLTPEALWLLLPGLVYFAVWALGWKKAQQLNHLDAEFAAPASPPTPSRAERAKWRAQARAVLGEGGAHFVCAMGALALGTMALLKLVALAQRPYAAGSLNFGPVDVIILGGPFMLALFALVVTLMIGLIGRHYSDQSREWWARQGAWMGILASAWLVLFCSVYYVPPLVHWALDQRLPVNSVVTALSVVLTYLGLRSGSSAQTGKRSNGKRGAGKRSTDKRSAPVRPERLAQLAPYAFSVLLIGALTVLLQLVATGFPLAVRDTAVGETLAFSDYTFAYTTAPLQIYLGWTVLTCLLTAAVLGVRVDINKFSLYMMYRLRLVRAYFGATSKKRTPHPFTGFDPADDIPLASLLQRRGGGAAQLQRPYHIINMALNLVKGDELAWQSRKAANFVMTPAFCGFEMPVLAGADRVAVCPQRGAFRPTTQYASKTLYASITEDDSVHDSDDDIKLGAAVAISGAAASPNMGYHSSPPLNFLMTLFNLRLGRWSPNPMKGHGVWKRASPDSGLWSIFAELFGWTDIKANFLYLSDGGHFENLGMYELVRRRCRLIVVVDASSDAEQSLDALGNAIRKCRTDFNIPIELDARQIKPPAQEALGANCVTGRVCYSHADAACEDGLLIYVKPMMVGNENADVVNYSRGHPEFPHQSTSDQFFDEDQFESYRALGYATAHGAFSTMLAGLRASAAAPRTRSQRVDQVSKHYLARLVHADVRVPAL